VTGSKFGDIIAGVNSGDILYGMGGADTIAGGSCSDTLYGGAGVYGMTGGGGADRFGYLGASDGGDTITDFSTAQGEGFSISHTGFGGGRAASGSPTGSQFVTGSAANGQFIWNPASSTLSWDSDGTGSAQAQNIATLNGVTTLTAASIHLV
jgi:Ca2+-binding RTX toxin-like protein